MLENEGKKKTTFLDLDGISFTLRNGNFYVWMLYCTHEFMQAEFGTFLGP